jgi:hypothetical protein
MNPVHTTISNCPRFIFILLSLLRLGLPRGLFPSGFLTKPHVYSSSPHSCYVLCPAHLIWLDHSNYIWGRVQVMMLPIIQVSPTSYYFISVMLLYLSLNTKPLKRLGNVRNAPHIFSLPIFTLPLLRPSETASVPGRNGKEKMSLMGIKSRSSKLRTFTFLTQLNKKYLVAKRNLTMTQSM